MQDFASFIRRRRPGWYDQDTDEEAIRNYQADELATAEANPGNKHLKYNDIIRRLV